MSHISKYLSYKSSQQIVKNDTSYYPPLRTMPRLENVSVSCLFFYLFPFLSYTFILLVTIMTVNCIH